MGRFIIIIALLGILAGSSWLAYDGWMAHSDVEMPASAYVAMALGIVFSLIVGCGLMALVFYSHRRGYDDRAQAAFERDKPGTRRPAGR